MVFRLSLGLCLLLVSPENQQAWADDDGANVVVFSKQIDQSLGAELKFAEQAERLAPQTDDQTFVRRVYLDLTGKLPTPVEIEAFCKSTDPEKRQRLIEKLINDSRFGENWGTYFRDVIFYRKSEDRGAIGIEPTERYFADALNQGRGWDQIATDFITASGSPNENGATGIIIAHLGKPEETVAEISRVFLGIQIQCAQCHDHPFDEWTREQFHELAAFFPRVAVRPVKTSDKRDFQVVGNDQFPKRRAQNPNNRQMGTPEHLMPDLDNPSAPGTRMQPIFFINGQSLPFDATDAERRSTLASWITDPSDVWFARALVNRIWAELVGEPFYFAIDDMGPDRQCKAPATMDLICQEFVAKRYDVKWLFAAIMGTQAYQRVARENRNADETPFLANRVSRLRADQIAGSLENLIGINDSAPDNRKKRAAQQLGLQQRFGFDPSERRDEIGGSIPQSLFLMNSPVVNRLIALSLQRGTLSRVIRSAKDETDAINQLYLNILARRPRPAEIEQSRAYVENSETAMEGYQDIVWALVNSAEFVHRY